MMRMELERELLSRPVWALQYMLGRLALVYDFMPTVAESGVFDENTLEAVMRFQREFDVFNFLLVWENKIINRLQDQEEAFIE